MSICKEVSLTYSFGEMAEWSNAVASKAIIPCKRDRGFESPSLLHFLPLAKMHFDCVQHSSESDVGSSETSVVVLAGHQ